MCPVHYQANLSTFIIILFKILHIFIYGCRMMWYHTAVWLMIFAWFHFVTILCIFNAINSFFFLV